MTMARAKRAAVNGSTARSAAPSRRCRCQSSGRRSVRDCHWRAPQRGKHVLLQQQLEREAHAEAGDVGVHVAESAAAAWRTTGRRAPRAMSSRHEARQEARREDVIALALDGALHDVGDLALEVGVVVGLEREIPHALAAGAAGARRACAASAGRLVNTPLMRSVSAYTHAPVSVAKSSMRRGCVRAARASVSASTMRPSASVWITWMVTPLAARHHLLRPVGVWARCGSR